MVIACFVLHGHYNIATIGQLGNKAKFNEMRERKNIQLEPAKNDQLKTFETNRVESNFVNFYRRRGV